MFLYNLKLISRYFIRNKMVSLFSILGLSFGFSVFLYVFTYISFENSYDKYLKDADNTFRLHVNSSTIQWARSLFFLGNALNQKSPAISEETTFIYSEQNTIIDPQSGKPVIANHFMAIDTNFINFFGFNVKSGNKKDIGLPNTALITPEFSQKYFGSENPIGKELDVKTIQYCEDVGKFTIVGVVDKPPENTHFTFSVLLSQKGNLSKRVKFLSENAVFGSYTYLKLFQKQDITIVHDFIREILLENQSKFRGPALSSFSHTLQPVLDIHRKSNLGHELKNVNSGKQVFILFIVGIVILLISLINFVILHSARIFNRGKEIAYRKISGARTISLIKYFSLESVLYSLVSIYIATIIIELIRPWVVKYFNIDVPLIYSNFNTLIILVVLIIFCVLVFNLFIVAFIRKISIINTFKLGNTGKSGGEYFRKILTIIQFAGAIGLLIFAISVYKQIEYMQTKDMGFKTESVIVVSFQNNDFVQQPFINQIKTIPSVINVTRCQQHPGYPMNIMGFPLADGDGLPVKLTTVDKNYIKSMNIEIVNYLGDAIQKTESDKMDIFINEKMYHILIENFNNDLNHMLTNWDNVNIQGVVKNFHFASLHHAIEPFFFFIGKEEARYKFMLINLKPGETEKTLREIKSIWDENFPGYYFNYFFLDDFLINQYKGEMRVFKAIKIIIPIILLIISMGLIGSITFIMKNREKEIAVRKILGASYQGLLKYYLFKISSIVVIAFVIIFPVMYYVLKAWYANFQYHAQIQWLEFIFSGIIILIYTWIIIFWMIQKNIRKNPVESLRYE